MRFGNGIQLGGSGAPTATSGAGSPEAVVTAPIGSTYHRTDGVADATFYRKESGAGNTGWVAVSNANTGLTHQQMMARISVGF